MSAVPEDDLLDGCGGAPGPTTNDDELPYVVLFASAMQEGDEPARAAHAAGLAEQYHELFGADRQDPQTGREG